MTRPKLLLLALPLLLCRAPMVQAKENKPLKNVPSGATPREVEMGRKISEEIDKNPKVKILDPKKNAASQALYDKLNTMIKILGKASARPDIQYEVKVIEDDNLNAFTLPNGRVYVYRGLLDWAGSDDELAAVLAHEIGHNARMHAIRGEAKAKKLSLISLAAMAAMLAGGSNGGNVAAFSQYALAGVMNTYSVEYEKEADRAAVESLAKTPYNPSAIVTLMQRFAQEERQHPDIEQGIFRTHPASPERVEAGIETLKELNIAYTPRNVEGAPQATSALVKDRVVVKMGDVTLMELAPKNLNGVGAKARGEQIAKQINALLKNNLKFHELTTSTHDKSAALMARDQVVAIISPDDAALQNLTPLACAQKWRTNFGRLFWRETVNGKM